MKGFFVSPISIKEMLEIYNARFLIEFAMMKLSMQNGDDAWEANIIAKMYQYNKYKESPPYDFKSFQERLHEVQKAMHDACDSPTLKRIRDLLFDQSERYRNIWFKGLVDKDFFKVVNKKNISKKEGDMLWDSLDKGLSSLTIAVINRDKELVSKILKNKINDFTKNIEKQLKVLGIKK